MKFMLKNCDCQNQDNWFFETNSDIYQTSILRYFDPSWNKSQGNISKGETNVAYTKVNFLVILKGEERILPTCPIAFYNHPKRLKMKTATVGWNSEAARPWVQFPALREKKKIYLLTGLPDFTVVDFHTVAIMMFTNSS
jgi:hypothetical protein